MNFPSKSEQSLLCNACHHVQSRENLINRLREKFKNVDLGLKMLHLHHFLHVKNFPQKSKTVTFNHFFNAFHHVQFYKNLIKRFRVKFKSIDSGPKNASFTPFLATIRIFLKNPKHPFLHAF